MPDTKITIDNSGSQIKHSPAGTTPLPPSAGLPVTVQKAAGGQTTSAHGQVSATTVVFDNPA